MAATFEFVSGGLQSDHFELRSVRGRERLSRLFEFDLILGHAHGPLDDDHFDKLLHGRCAISLGDHDADVVHGMLSSLELVTTAPHQTAYYRARMVPNMWLLTLPRSNRIFRDMGVKTMVKTIFTDYGFTADDYTLLIPEGTEREYVVQYEESDWDFIQRWLEHEGYFYWFEHHASGEKLIIGSKNADASTFAGRAGTLSHRDHSNIGGRGTEHTIWNYGLVQRRIPARAASLDYNYRTPHIKLASKLDVTAVDKKATGGFGSVFSYGENFKTTDEGDAITRLRAERLVATRRTYSGKTDSANLRVGYQIEVDNHYVPGFDGKYLITGMDHHAGIPFDSDLTAAHPPAGHGYEGTVEAIPILTEFRPDRSTPWPRIHGVMHARIDSDTSGDYADIDDQGRYFVKMPFDVSGRNGSRVSHPIRMAENYAGAAYGSHYPLHKGTEVLVAHIDGNPDRPVIVASVPNTRTVSPVTKTNATQSVVQTASGMRMEWEDRQN